MCCNLEDLLLHKNLPFLPVLPVTIFTGKSVNWKTGKTDKFIYRRNSSAYPYAAYAPYILAAPKTEEA